MQTPRILSMLVFAAAVAQAPALSGCLGGFGCGGDVDYERGDYEATFYPTDKVTDATIVEPTFKVDGKIVDATCGEYDAIDPSLCIAEILVLRPGVHTITVEAEGYRPESIQVGTTQLSSMHIAVQLEPMQE